MTDGLSSTQWQRAEVSAAFPERPISDPKLLSGRKATIARCAQILGPAGSTLLLYGDYAVGKTSVWRVLLKGLR
jgi:hypothetical protein